MSKTAQWYIFYDGLCLVCSKEMNHYQKLKGAENFVFIDITHPDFHAHHYQLNPQDIHQALHIQNVVSKKILTGVDAFIVIWDLLPSYQIFGRLAKLRWVRPGLQLGYKIFAKYRKFLPKVKQNCQSSPYCEYHPKEK